MVLHMGHERLASYVAFHIFHVSRWIHEFKGKR
jgi:hypothetical protein